VADINHRRISVMKLRENEYDGANRILTISGEGMAVGGLSALANVTEPEADGNVG
jgi:circadian clock protein KaiC